MACNIRITNIFQNVQTSNNKQNTFSNKYCICLMKINFCQEFEQKKSVTRDLLCIKQRYKIRQLPILIFFIKLCVEFSKIDFRQIAKNYNNYARTVITDELFLMKRCERETQEQIEFNQVQCHTFQSSPFCGDHHLHQSNPILTFDRVQYARCGGKFNKLPFLLRYQRIQYVDLYSELCTTFQTNEKQQFKFSKE